MKAATLHVRAATGADSVLLWRWANDRAVRSASFHSADIPWAEHRAWFDARLKSDSCRIYIVETADGEGVGQVRFDVEADGSARVGVIIAAKWRGRGLGAEAIARSCEAFRRDRDVPIVAHIRPENIASLRIFERAGFKRVGQERVGEYDSVRMELPTGCRVVFRPDAGAGIGLGHLQRCLALAEAFRKRGATSVFVARGAAADRARAHGFEVVDDGPTGTIAADVDLVGAAAAAHRSGVIVVDSYEVDADYLARLETTGALVGVIDDLARMSFSADFVINGGVVARELGYRSSTGRTRFLLGPEYALLHPAFWIAGGPREIGDVRRVLVTVGGSDTQGLMPRLLQAIDDVPQPFEMTAIVGPFFDRRDVLDAAFRQCRHPVKAIDAPENLAGLMQAADLAVSAAGQTLYELAAVGTPVVAVQAADNQAANLRGMETAGTVRFAGESTDLALGQRVSQLVRDLIGDHEARRRMSAAGRRLIDGRGALRTADAIAALTREDAPRTS